MGNIKGNKHYSYKFKLKVVKDIIKYKSFGYVIKKYNISSNSATKWHSKYLNNQLHLNNTGKHQNNRRIIDIDCKNINLLSIDDKICFENILLLKSKNWTRIQKYQYIYKTKQNVSYLCWLLNIVRSSYYKWINKGLPPINGYKHDINKLVLLEYQTHKIKFGYRRLKQQILRNEGKNISEYHVRKYMKLNKIVGKKNLRTKFKINKNTKQVKNISNHIKGVFRSDNINEKWYMDYTYVRVNGKFLYVLFLLDGYNKEVINYKITSKKSPIITKNMIKESLKDVKEPRKIIIHSDQGSEFNNISVNGYLVNKGIRQSFSKKGSPLQNALIESLMSNFKRDFNPGEEIIVNKNHLLKLVSDWLVYYNELIPQRVLDYMTPAEYSYK